MSNEPSDEPMPGRIRDVQDEPVTQSRGEAEDGGQRSSLDRHAEDQVLLAEYTALRTEVERRTGIQWNVVALQITSAGAVAGIAISTRSDPALVLIVPLFSYMLGSRYILHDFHIKLIQQYIRTSLSGRLHDQLKWDQWKVDTLSRIDPSGWFQMTRWNVVHPTRLVFEGAASLALVAAALGSFYRRWNDPPHWMLIVGFGLLWIIGAAATVVLHRSFNAASGAEAVRLPNEG
jgi:hypothetical protein